MLPEGPIHYAGPVSSTVVNRDPGIDLLTLGVTLRKLPTQSPTGSLQDSVMYKIEGLTL